MAQATSTPLARSSLHADQVALAALPHPFAVRVEALGAYEVGALGLPALYHLFESTRLQVVDPVS